MKYVAVGIVRPERIALTLPQQVWKKENHEYTIACINSQLFITMNDPRIDGYKTAQYTAEHMGQVFVNAIGFLVGCDYKVEITQVIDEANNFQISSVQRQEVISELTAETLWQEFADILTLTRTDIWLRFAIHDFTNAITDIVGGSILCYRAIEGLAKAFTLPGAKKTNWESMNSTLNSDQETMQRLVTDFAMPLRHGNWSELKPMSDTERGEMLSFTKRLICNYIVWSKTQSAAIPIE